MKACFFLQRRFAYLGHQMAILLQEKYGVRNFCGFVTLRSGYDFLRAQTEINYAQLVLEEDIYASYKNEKVDLNFLDKFEKDYGLPNLWPYINLDRILRYNLLVRSYPSDQSKYSHEDLIKIFQATAKAVVKFLEEAKPDFIVFSVISNLSSSLLYEVARKKGIKTFLIYDSRLENKQMLAESYDKHPYLYQSIEYIKNHPDDGEVKKYYEQAKTFLQTFQDKPFYYMKYSEAEDKFSKKSANFLHHFNFFQPRNFLQSIGWFFRAYYIYFSNKFKDKRDYSTIKPWWETWDKLVRKGRILRGYRDLYDEVDLQADYVYFALHTEPEALFPYSAPFYTDQQWVIEQVARSLPLHYKLYVKDHPLMYGLRPRNYYKAIKKIPNVKLIDPSVDSMKLSQNSKMLITVTGTAGWEALLLKKPVIVFGTVFYSGLSGVKLCSDINKLPYLVKEQLNNPNIYNEEELLGFIAALYRESVFVDIWQIWDVEGAGKIEKKKAALAPLVDLLARKLALNKSLV